MNESISNTIKCSICRSDINPNTSFFQSAVTFGVVCSSCKEKFSEEDITLILELLLVYEGYFGMYERSHFCLEEMIKEVVMENKDVSGVPDFGKMHINILHKALTYGITPQEFEQQLVAYLEA